MPSGPVFRRRRQSPDSAEASVPGAPLQLQAGDLGPTGPAPSTGPGEDSVVNIGEECEEWPVQKVETQTNQINFADNSISNHLLHSVQYKGR